MAQVSTQLLIIRVQCTLWYNIVFSIFFYFKVNFCKLILAHSHQEIKMSSSLLNIYNQISYIEKNTSSSFYKKYQYYTFSSRSSSHHHIWIWKVPVNEKMPSGLPFMNSKVSHRTDNRIQSWQLWTSLINGFPFRPTSPFIFAVDILPSTYSITEDFSAFTTLAKMDHASAGCSWTQLKMK